MTESTQNQPKTVLESILDWSLNKPLWQRDALRRIVQKNTLDENDTSELLLLLKKPHFGSESSNLSAAPLEASHIPSSQLSTESIYLEGISDVQGVNSLAPNQTLNFSAKGITVIYGDNGVGKSGYTRILKSACRARHRSEILSNIYAAEQPQLPSATIKYGQGAANNKSINWKSSDKPDSTLSVISVFDRECATVHVRNKNKVAYRPYGLDVPDTLASVCQALENKLKEELSGLESRKNNIFLTTPWKNTTQVGQAVSKLSSTSKVDSFKELSLLTAEQNERLMQLNETLSKDLRKAAGEQKNKADNIKSLIFHLNALVTQFSDENINKAISLKAAALEARKAAIFAAETAFSGGLLPEVGGDTWKRLWEAARNYSAAAAYNNKEFPYTEDNSQCVLCQQPLDNEAKIRLKNFESFIKGELEAAAKVAEATFELDYKNFQKIIKLPQHKAVLKELKIINAVLYRSIIRFLASIKLRKINLQKKLDTKDHVINDFAENPVKSLEENEANFRKLSSELEAAVDESKLNLLKSERQELADRDILKQHIDAIEIEINRLKNIELINKCLADTKTRTITMLGNTIADDVITPQLRDRFLKEIIELVGNRFRVEIQRSGGSYGSPEYKVSLLSDPKRDVSSILSEGEQTCVAIASFLAELATTTHKSALVFDDPISSLDHKWRSIVAERLVKESKERQVIVFTHDLVFLNDLEDFAERHGIEFSSRHLDRLPETVGLVNESLPWDGMKIAARVDALEKEARDLKSKRSGMSDEDYKNAAKLFYSKLRASWERALEEVGLAHTVMRHRDYINAKDIIKISALDANDCTIWQDNFGKCCTYTEAHDGSRGRNQTLPEPDALLLDTTVLGNWVKNIRDKHKNIA